MSLRCINEPKNRAILNSSCFIEIDKYHRCNLIICPQPPDQFENILGMSSVQHYFYRKISIQNLMRGEEIQGLFKYRQECHYLPQAARERGLKWWLLREDMYKKTFVQFIPIIFFQSVDQLFLSYENRPSNFTHKIYEIVGAPMCSSSNTLESWQRPSSGLAEWSAYLYSPQAIQFPSYIPAQVNNKPLFEPQNSPVKMAIQIIYQYIGLFLV